MKVTFYIDKRRPTASSDLLCKGFDCMRLIADDFRQHDGEYKKLAKLAATGDDFEWWGEFLRVFCTSGRVRVLHPGCEDDEYAELSLSVLRMFLKDWQIFIRDGKTREVIY